MSKHPTINTPHPGHATHLRQPTHPRHSGASRNPVTEYLNIWTTAQEQKIKGRGKRTNTQSIYGIKKLRELILELAVRGKLVPQNHDDEPASTLLQRIAEEKEELIKAGRIRKQKPMPEVSDGEKPFGLPKGWEWTRWDSVAMKIGDIDHKMPVQVPIGIPYVSPRDFTPDNGINFKGAKKIAIEDFLRLSAKIQPKKGDIIYPRYGTIGENRLVSTDEDFLASYSCCVIKTLSKFISPKYQFIFSISRFTKDQAKRAENKTTQANVGIKSIQNYVMPLPPLAEQHRIVAKVGELMTLCDQLEQQQTNSNATHQTLVGTLLATLTHPTTGTDGTETNPIEIFFQHFDTLFTTEQSIDQLKQTILQLAVMGKLVPQNPANEPASTLLRRMAKEKERLIKAGEIKRQKISRKISNEEKPFQLPAGWEWINLGTALNKITDGTHHSPPNGEKGEYLYISAKNIKPDGVMLSNATYVSKEMHSEIYSRCNPEHGDILYIKDGATTGVVTINDLEQPFSMLSSVALLKLPTGILNKYLLLTLRSPYFYDEMRAGMTGVAITRVTLKKLNDAFISLPPLAEQKRIVAKADELTTLCDTLKVRLNRTRTTRVQLADTFVEQVAN